MESLTPSIPNALIFSLLLTLSFAAATGNPSESFSLCFSHHVPGDHEHLLYAPDTTSYTSLLLSSINNKMFVNSTSKPLLIVAPAHESHVQAAVVCGKQHNLHLRIRSGGHDIDGISYRSVDDSIPFVLLDLSRLRSISIDAQKMEAWVESGATNGELHYNLAKVSPTIGFPTGSYPTVGLGGHVSGGGIGPMRRKYGLAADNVIDCRVVDVRGRILDRESMGEDLFWAVRGGGGASFGVIISYKITLVDVPPKVTVFLLMKSRSQGAMELLNQWQYIAYKLPVNTYLSPILMTSGDTREARYKATMVAFECLFLGGKEELLSVMAASFPDLGLVEGDCLEMSWAQSNLFLEGFSNITLEKLLDRTPINTFMSEKYDFVDKPIPKKQWEAIWERMLDEDADVRLWLEPSGGRMYEIPETATPFPHREGIIYKILYLIMWEEDRQEASRKHVEWMNQLFEFLTPYVSKNPRAGYMNTKDLYFGRNKEVGKAYYEEASVWGKMYFKDNFIRLALVKGMVDPENYFWHEQSIPPLFQQDGNMKDITRIPNVKHAPVCAVDMY